MRRVGNEGQKRGWTGKSQSRDKRREAKDYIEPQKLLRLWSIGKNPQLCHLLQHYHG